MKEKENEAKYLFHQGTNYYAYKYMGANCTGIENLFNYTFRTWAPNAYSVTLVSDFSDWDNGIKMSNTENGVWEVEINSNQSLSGSAYKFKINGKNGVHFKGDPYALYSKGGSDGASVIFESKFNWSDEKWLAKRKENINTQDSYLPIPINVYELHFASFMRTEDDKYMSYSEMAEILPFYLRYMGYTHVEFMPIAEYPYDASWGYQVGAFFAISSRFGTPDEFRYLINTLHNSGIGVIIDWVPAHFPKDEWGLYEFDGMPLYEYQGYDRQESLTWGTRFFDVGREEVQSFLVSNALFYFREFHVDGLRIDAVASMLYLDYDKPEGIWTPNVNGGKENLEAIAFFQKLNERVFSEFPEALMIAEESGDFGKITHRTTDGGLGFNLKWNMGWANDFYKYLELDPIFRKHNHCALTFPLMYAYSENYLLPISHDEVVHGKLSFINKTWGNYEDKFKQARAAILLLMTYPGKKMLFMGTEFAQFREWDYGASLEWFMLDYENHHSFREFVASLNRFYLKHDALWFYDFSEAGFKWICVDDNDKNTIVFKRIGSEEELTVIINFSGETQSVRFKVTDNNALICIFDSINYATESEKEVYPIKIDDNLYIDLNIPPFSARIYSAINRDFKIY